MIALIQRVNNAKVLIAKKVYSEISHGYLIFLGIFQDDNEEDIDKLVDKIVNLRIMADAQGKMNRSILDTKGEILVVSQFTLCADVTGGRRPSFVNAKNPQDAEKLYEQFAQKLKAKNLSVKTGKFAAYMDVQLSNDGPVTLIVKSS